MKYPLFIAALLSLLLAPSLAQADEVPIKFSPEWTFNAHPEYKGATGSVTVAPDGTSLQLAYDFTNGGSFVSTGAKLSDIPSLSGVEVKVTGPGNFSVTLVDSTGQTFVYHLGPPGESSPAFEIDTTAPSASYGGAKDKTMHFPLKYISVMVSKTTDGDLTGTNTIAGILLKGVQAAPTTATGQ